MAVPARPVSGQPIATPWGAMVHDAIVATDIQAGTTSLAVTTATGSKLVTFPRPFTAPPVVIVTIANKPTNGDAYNARVENVTATGFTLWLIAPSGWSVTFTIGWLAMGPRT